MRLSCGDVTLPFRALLAVSAAATLWVLVLRYAATCDAHLSSVAPLNPTCSTVRASLDGLGVGQPLLHCPGQPPPMPPPDANVTPPAANMPLRGVLQVHYAGRSGNHLIQHFAVRFIAARLGWALLAPPGALGELGEPAGANETCPPGAPFPWSWLRALPPPIFDNLNFRATVAALGRPAAARVAYSNMFWEHADVAIAAVAHSHKSTSDFSRGSAALLHPWLPSAVSDVYSRFLGDVDGGHAGAWPPPSHPLVRDANGTLVLHIRLEDLAVYSIEQCAKRRQHEEWQKVGDAARLSFSWRGKIEADMPPDFSAALRNAAAAGTLPAFAAMAGLPPLLEMLEEEVVVDWFVALPLSFYRAVIEGSGPPGGGAWRAILLITDAASVGHPLVRALVETYGALVQARSVIDDFATLMAAHELVIPPSTLSFMAALLGRARTVHWAHAGTGGANIKEWGSGCLLPAALQGAASAPHAARFVFHDVLRAGITAIARKHSTDAARMQGRHGWAPGDLEACLQRHPGPYFISSAELIGFYRDVGCARVFMPQALRSDGRGQPRVELCTDAFVDWDALLPPSRAAFE